MKLLRIQNIILIKIVLMCCTNIAFAATCDVDNDNDIDKDDIKRVMSSRGHVSKGVNDPRDANSDGHITMLDARMCQRLCTLARCEVPATNLPPVADASPDQQVIMTTNVALDGSSSYDHEGQPLSYQWQFLNQPSNSLASLQFSQTAYPEFIADLPGEYQISLVVNDGVNDSQPSTVKVTAHILPAPQSLVAVPGDSQIFVSWANDSLADSYWLYWHTDANVSPSSYTGFSPVSHANFTITGLQNNQQYYIVVVSEKNGIVGKVSIPSTATPIRDVALEDNYIFDAYSGFEQGWEPWVTDGTPEGTFILKNINITESYTNHIGEYFSFNNSVYFIATSDSLLRKNEIWKSDGTPESTIQVTNFANVGLASASSPFCQAGEKLLFNGHDLSLSFAGLISLSKSHNLDLVSSFEGINCRNSANFGGKLIYSKFSLAALDMVASITDGVTLRSIRNGTQYIHSPDRITNVNGSLFYFSRTSSTSTTLWRADDDGGNPQALANFAGINSSRVEETDEQGQMVELNGKLYFNADDGIHGHTLWVSDGSIMGTYMVKDLDNAPTDTEVFNLHVFDNKILFSANGALWTSDGTSSGTYLLSNNGPVDSVISTHVAPNVVVANGLYFYTALDVNGYELWASDGTASGTYMVKDINPSGSSSPVQLVARSGYILFTAKYSDIDDGELWRSDGTANNTFLIKDICPEPYCSGLLPLPF